MVSRRFAPATPVGSGIVCTSAPAGVYSSRNTGAAAPLSAPPPSPSLATTMLPAVNPAACASGSTPNPEITSEPTTAPTSKRRNFERTADSSGGDLGVTAWTLDSGAARRKSRSGYVPVNARQRAGCGQREQRAQQEQVDGQHEALGDADQVQVADHIADAEHHKAGHAQPSPPGDPHPARGQRRNPSQPP